MADEGFQQTVCTCDPHDMRAGLPHDTGCAFYESAPITDQTQASYPRRGFLRRHIFFVAGLLQGLAGILIAGQRGALVSLVVICIGWAAWEINNRG